MLSWRVEKTFRARFHSILWGDAIERNTCRHIFHQTHSCLFHCIGRSENPGKLLHSSCEYTRSNAPRHMSEPKQNFSYFLIEESTWEQEKWVENRFRADIILIWKNLYPTLFSSLPPPFQYRAVLTTLELCRPPYWAVSPFPLEQYLSSTGSTRPTGLPSG